MKKRMIAFLLCCMVFGGCGSQGVSQEEYDKVIEERDELKESSSNEENPARDFFEEIEGVTVSESGDSRRKSLVLTCYAKLYTDNDAMSDTAESIGENLGTLKKKIGSIMITFCLTFGVNPLEESYLLQ